MRGSNPRKSLHQASLDDAPATPRAFLGRVVKRIGFCFVAIRGCALTRLAPAVDRYVSEKKKGRRSVSDDGPKGVEQRQRAAPENEGKTGDIPRLSDVSGPTAGRRRRGTEV